MRNHRLSGQFAVRARKKKAFYVPLTADIVVKRGRADLVAIRDNFYNVVPPPMPVGWDIDVKQKPVPRKAEIFFNRETKEAKIHLDSGIFGDKDVPTGAKVFMFFHEIGHLIHGPNEALCDEFAFLHALRAGVSPYICFMALYVYMPQSYAYRVERLRRIIVSHPELKNQADNHFCYEGECSCN